MQNKTFYNEILTEHNRNPYHKHPLKVVDLMLEGVNPSCGDDILLNLKMNGDVIEDASFQGDGCAISQASADMMSDLMVDKTPQEAIELCRLFGRMVRGEETDDSKLAALDEAASLKDVSHMPARVKCAELAWRTLEEMLQNGSDKPGSTATASCVMPPHTHDGQE